MLYNCKVVVLRIVAWRCNYLLRNDNWMPSKRVRPSPKWLFMVTWKSSTWKWVFCSGNLGGPHYSQFYSSLVGKYLLESHLRGAYDKFTDFFVQAFKIVVDTWNISMLLLYILWDDWTILMISYSNEQLQQQLGYTLLQFDCYSWWI